MQPEILLTTPIYATAMEQLDKLFTVHRLWQAKDRAALLAELRDRTRAIATFGGFRVDGALMDALPKTEIVSTMSIGVDHIDLAAAKARGIAVTNTPDVLTDDVADIGMALTLAVARRLIVGDRYVRQGKWPSGAFPLATKIGGATMGILGLGRIGLAVAKRAEAFGMKIVYHGPRAKPVGYRHYASLTEMARDIDYLVVTCPGGAETRNLVNAEVLAALGKKGAVINIARGSVIDEETMVKMLQDGSLGGAGLDVFRDEPRVPEALLALDNVVLQPHVGSATHATRGAMGQLVVDNLTAHFAGRPLLTRVV